METGKNCGAALRMRLDNACEFTQNPLGMRLIDRYLNLVTGETSKLPPPDFRGGILADAMGLGKTLTVLALLAFRQAPQPSRSWEDHDWSSPECTSHSSRTTLVVVPLSRTSLGVPGQDAMS